MKNRGNASILVLASLFAISNVYGFDCRRATSSTEATICRNPTLNALDNELGSAYKRVLALAADPGDLMVQEQTWLDDVRDQCQDIACLTKAYTDRLRELKHIGRSAHAVASSAEDDTSAPQRPSGYQSEPLPSSRYAHASDSYRSAGQSAERQPNDSYATTSDDANADLVRLWKHGRSDLAIQLATKENRFPGLEAVQAYDEVNRACQQYAGDIKNICEQTGFAIKGHNVAAKMDAERKSREDDVAHARQELAVAPTSKVMARDTPVQAAQAPAQYAPPQNAQPVQSSPTPSKTLSTPLRPPIATAAQILPELVNRTGEATGDADDTGLKLILVALLSAYLFLFVGGVTNKFVVFYDKKDFLITAMVFIAPLVGFLLSSFFEPHGHQSGEPATWLMRLCQYGGLAAAAIFSIWTLRLSMLHNRNIPVGIVVAVFKIVTALLAFIVLIAYQPNSKTDTLAGAMNRQREAGVFLLVVGILGWIAGRLINGRRVYIARNWDHAF